jgi:hypothetical protein
MDYDLIDATVEKGLCLDYGVKNAPTLIIPEGEMLTILDNVSEIKKYLEGKKK